MKIAHVLTHSIEIYGLNPDLFSKYDAYIHIYAKISRALGYNSFVGYLSSSVKNKLTLTHKYGHIMIAYPVTVNRVMPVRGRFGHEMSVDMIIDLIRSNVDIIHVHSYYLFMYDAIALIIKKNRGKKIVAHYHGGDPSMLLYPFKIIKRTTLPLADKIIATNRTEVKRLINYWGIPKEKVVHIPNGVDTEFFRPLPYIEKSSNVVLYVGNLVKGKGLEMLLKAFAHCKQEIKHLKLWIVGDGYLRPRLELLAQTLGISKDVTFFGRLTHDELRNIYNLAAATILPSEKESFGLVLVESMACGTPVVAIITEGSIEIVKDKVNGLLVPQYDEEAISEAICKIISDRSLRQIMSENARRYAVECFSWEKIKKRLNTLYRSLLAD